MKKLMDIQTMESHKQKLWAMGKWKKKLWASVNRSVAKSANKFSLPDTFWTNTSSGATSLLALLNVNSAIKHFGKTIHSSTTKWPILVKDPSSEFLPAIVLLWFVDSCFISTPGARYVSSHPKPVLVWANTDEGCTIKERVCWNTSLRQKKKTDPGKIVGLVISREYQILLRAFNTLS